MKKFVCLVLSFSCLAASSGCGLRNTLQARKQADADKAAEHAHDVDKGLQDKDAASAMSDFQIHRKYFLAMVGDYEGAFVTSPSTTADTDPSLPPLHGTISVQITLEHDLAQFNGVETPTVAQIQTQDQALSLLISIEENIVADGAHSVVHCDNDGVKPDFDTGLINFTCTGSAVGGAGRTYSFGLDELDLNPRGEPTPDLASKLTPNMIEGLAGQASSRLLSGAISTIGGLNVQIKAPYEKTFLGELNRKTDEK